MTASCREIENEQRLVSKRTDVFNLFRSNGLIHRNASGLNLEIDFLRHTVGKSIATERSNSFFQLGFFFLLFFDGCLTQILHLLLIALTDFSQGILRKLHSVCRIVELQDRFLKTEDKVIYVKFGLELVANSNKLIGKLQTQQIRELGVVRRIRSNCYSGTRRGRSLSNRLCPSDRVDIGLNFFVVPFGKHGAIRARFFVALTGNNRITVTHSLKRVRSHLSRKSRILMGFHVVTDCLNHGIFVQFFTHLARNNRKVLTAKLSTQHISKLLVIGRICGNGSRLCLRITCITSNKSEGCSPQSNLRYVHENLLGELKNLYKI